MNSPSVWTPPWRWLAAVLLMACCSAGARTLTLSSPDTKVQLALGSSGGQLHYSVSVDGELLIGASPLAYAVASGGSSWLLGTGVRSLDLRQSGDGCRQAGRLCREYLVAIDHQRADMPGLQLMFRLFDDGLAFRYQPAIAGAHEIQGESTGVDLGRAESLWYQDDNAIDSHEGKYGRYTRAAVDPAQAIRLPLTAKLDNGVYLAISEANLREDSGLRLKSADGKMFVADFFEQGWPAAGGHHSPWRYLAIGRDLNALYQVDMVARLADRPDEALFADRSYIKPGKSVWHWLPEGPFGTLPARQKEYIDTAAELGFEYSLIDAGWKKFYAEQDPDGDKFKPLAELVAYAAERQVGLWLWLDVVDIADPIKRRQLFRRLQAMGLVGIKVDFFNVQYGDADAAGAIASYQEVLRDAAAFRLMVNFHGASKPSGLAHTFPNEMTREGVRGQEFEYKRGWLDPRHNAILPFTRFLLGAGDFTPVRFNATKLGASGNTASHQLALAGLLPSRVHNFSFSPDDIRRLRQSNPAVLDYLSALPAEWDESRVLPGSEIGKLVIIAKRRGDSWYLFSINGEDGDVPRQLSFAPGGLDFLGEGAYRADLWFDGDVLAVEHRQIARFRKEQPLKLSYAANGGAVIRFTADKALAQQR